MIARNSNSYPVLAAVRQCRLDRVAGDLLYSIATLLRDNVRFLHDTETSIEYESLRDRLDEIVGVRQSTNAIGCLRANLRRAQFHWLEEDRKRAAAVDC